LPTCAWASTTKLGASEAAAGEAAAKENSAPRNAAAKEPDSKAAAGGGTKTVSAASVLQASRLGRRGLMAAATALLVLLVAAVLAVLAKVGGGWADATRVATAATPARVAAAVLAPPALLGTAWLVRKVSIAKIAKRSAAKGKSA